MAMGKRRRRPKQTSIWVATQDLPRSASHPFYTRLNQILDKADFDGHVETLCQRFCADDVGHPGLPPGGISACCCWGTSKASTPSAPSHGGRHIR